jgi:hypothetical protein
LRLLRIFRICSPRYLRVRFDEFGCVILNFARRFSDNLDAADDCVLGLGIALQRCNVVDTLHEGRCVGDRFHDVLKVIFDAFSAS